MLKSWQELDKNYFIYGLILLCLFYLGFEFFFNAYTMFTVDEFWFAHRAYQYKDSLPYRDFAPYKTVLGYYLLLIPLLAKQGVIDTLIFTKNMIAILNASILFATSIWLARFFSRSAILTSLLLLISSDLMLSYSTNIRVDLFAYWLGFFSLLLLLEYRFVFAGILIGISFAISQKTLWYLFASDCALGIYFLIASRQTKTLLKILKFNFSALLPITIYIIFWSFVSSWHTAITSIFYEAAAMYNLDWYNASRELFWSFTLIYNPLLFLLWPLTIISLFVTYVDDNSYYRRLFVITYSLIILFCLIPYKQVFPYYMQVTIPIFLVTYSVFFTWLFSIFKKNCEPIFIVDKIYLISFIVIYTFFLMYIINKMGLPSVYCLLCIVPIALIIYLANPKKNLSLSSVSFNMVAVAIFFVGLIYPLTIFGIKLIRTNGSYQKANLEAANYLLLDSSTYVAGIDLIYNKSQPILGMKHLMGPAISYLANPSTKLRKVMLASLDEDPNATISSIINDLKKSAVKFYVNNYRIQALPNQIKTYLANEFEHWWASIYIYAPKVAAGKNLIHIKFTGEYRIESVNAVYLNGQKYVSNSNIYLKTGDYISQSKIGYRFKLLPEIPAHALNLNYTDDNWEKLAL